MRKLFLFIVGLLILSINGYAVDKYAQSAITSWATGPWYDAASGGSSVSAPVSGDNVFTNGFAVTVDADATCDNFTFTNVAGQITMSAGVTLTVRGTVNCTAAGTVDAFSNMNASAILKLTGDALSTPFRMVTDNASTGMKPKNVLIEPTNTANTYIFGETNKNYVHGSGKFTIKANTKLDFKTVCQLGTAATNEFIVEEGAVVTTTNHFKGAASNNTRIYKVTINGSVTCGEFSQLIATTLVLGNNATLKTSNSGQTNANVLTWDGWWGAKSLTAPNGVVADFGTPASLTMGTNTTIEFAKAGSQNINGIVPANGTNPSIAYAIPYVNLNVSGVGVKTIQTNLTVTGTLTVATGTTLAIASGKTLTLTSSAILNVAAGGKITNSGTIANAGTINLLSDATNGTATITGAGTITNTGTINVNQSLQHPSSALRTWYVSSPVDAAIAPTPALTTIKAFDEAANTWSASSLTNMDPKVGYMVVPADAANNLLYTTTGLLNTGAQNITLTGRVGVGANQGFNLVGNPYPSYLDWSLVSAANGISILRSSSMWYRTKDAGVYSFWTVNGAGVGTPATATKEIPPMQAFWVRAAEGGSTLALTDAMRVHAPASNKLLKAPAVNDLTLVRLQVSNGVNTDEAVIYFSENSQNGIDMLDAPKMSNNNVNIPEIHTTLGSEKYAINSMNSITLDTPISLGFVAGNASAFSITANEVTNLPAGVKLMLRDNVTLAETDLTDGVATYNFAPETTSTDRFSVIFRSAGATTGLENAIKNDVQVYVNANRQIVIVAAENTDYAIYNAIGSLVEKGVSTSKLQATNSKLNAGVYVVKTNSISKKVIVK